MARYTEYLADYRNFTPKKRLEQRERAGACTAQIAALVPLVPALTLRLPEGAPEEIVVKRDGEVVPAPSIGTALSMDPGEHVITTQVPGGPLVEHPIELQKGEKKELQLIVKLTADPPSDPIPPPASAAPPPILRPAPHLPGLSKPPAPEPPAGPAPLPHRGRGGRVPRGSPASSWAPSRAPSRSTRNGQWTRIVHGPYPDSTAHLRPASPRASASRSWGPPARQAS